MQLQRLQYLFDRCMADACTTGEYRELMELIQQPAYKEATEGMIRRALEEEEEYRLPDAASKALLAAVFNEQTTEPAQAKTSRLFIPGWIRYAAAAVLAGLLIGGSLLLFRGSAPKTVARQPTAANQQPKKTQDIQPGTDQAVLTLANGETIVLDHKKKGQIAAEGGTTVINLSGLLSYNGANSTGTEMQYNTVAVPRKGQYQLILSDGTKVWLNAESSLRFPVVFTGNSRVVELSGEGYFEIAHNAAKPFHVKAGNTDVEALGTHFNVMAYANEAALETTLLEGSVKVSTPVHNGILRPGQQSAMDKSSNAFVIKEADVEAATAWKNGIFLFGDKTSLPSVMRQLERWYDIDVNYESTPPAQSFFGGGIQRSLPLSGVLSVLRESGIRFNVNGKQITVLK